MKTLHFAAALLSLTSLSHAAWTVEPIDTGTTIGGAASLALSSQGVPHIAYYRPNSTAGFADLYYATKPGASWTTELIYFGFSFAGAGQATSIALTDQGNPAVTFTRATTFLEYSIRTAGAWTSPADITTAGGGYSSLIWHGAEAAPQPVAAYYDSANGDLRYAYYTAAWNTTNLDNSGNSGAFCSMAQVGSYMGIVYIDAGKLGFYESVNNGANWDAYSDNAFAPFNTITNVSGCALALAPAVNSASTNIRAHIIYYDSTASRFYYETNDTSNGTWKAPEMIRQTALNTVGYVSLSIAVGSDGLPQVAFLDYSTNQLVYARRTASGWPTPEIVDGANVGGAYCTLKLDAADRPHIAFASLAFDSGSMTYQTSGLKYASISSSSGGGNGGGTKPSLSILGKKKRSTTAAKLTIKGTSANAVTVQWQIGRKPFKTVLASSGAWRAKVGPLVPGKNKIKFRAVASSGTNSSEQKIVITRTP